MFSIEIDLSGRILNANPELLSTLSCSFENLVGKSAEWLVHSDDREHSPANRADLIVERSTQHFENRVMCKDSSYRWLLCLYLLTGEFIYAFAGDITNVDQDQEQLRNSRGQFTDISAQTDIGLWLASISYEIKRPLAAIGANASAARRWLQRPDPDLAEALAILDRIVKDGARVDELNESIRAAFLEDPIKASLV